VVKGACEAFVVKLEKDRKLGVKQLANEMTPSQCTAARALLVWTRPRLATVAGRGLATIVNFERNLRSVSSEAVADIRVALERAGVEFIVQNGSGVRLRTE
jgi:hypothetical protein